MTSNITVLPGQIYTDVKEALFIANELEIIKYLYDWPLDNKPFIEHLHSDPILQQMLDKMTIEHHSGCSMACLFRTIQYYIHNKDEWLTQQELQLARGYFIKSNIEGINCVVPIDII